MKKYLFFAAALVATFVSCNKDNFRDNASGEKVRMTVSAAAVETKTSVSTADNGLIYTPFWSKGDAIHVLEFVDGALSQEANSSPLEAAAASASFTLSLNKNETATIFKYYAVYPATSYGVDSADKNPFYRLELPEIQTFTAESFGEGSDLLISEPMAAAFDAQPQELKLKFNRIGSTARITVKELKAGEKISKVKISTEEGYISGYSKYDPVTGVWGGTYAGGSTNAITLTPPLRAHLHYDRD